MALRDRQTGWQGSLGWKAAFLGEFAVHPIGVFLGWITDSDIFIWFRHWTHNIGPSSTSFKLGSEFVMYLPDAGCRGPAPSPCGYLQRLTAIR